MADFTYLLRPKKFDDVVGQNHLCSPDAPLRSLCEGGNLTHSFFYGPPGCGKTTLARIIAEVMGLPFYEFNATSLKIENLRKIFDQYEGSLTKPLIFIDEVHRLAKNQQEVLLPVMEKNSVLVIGASTENPYFSLTAAMRSRSLLFELHSIGFDALEDLLVRTSVEMDEEAREYLIASSGGDARAMLKLLEVSTALNKPITLALLKSLRPAAQSLGSSEAGVHYDLASALIKSIRGSDPDAAIYYLARLIEGGEPPEFIARRLVILSSEDVGNANPQALTLCTSAMTSVKMIGYPESRIILAQAVIYLCASPKSNTAYNAINAAQSAVKNGVILDIPESLRQQHKGYLYPHDFGGWVEQKYLSKPLKFVEFKNSGYEAKMGEWIEKVWGGRES
ncbi:MAG: replication-associated recombination protein A [Sulfuricurvum sp.]|uniref:replication-associated recombination protein A n=1 Tax=Sulfuricurvum sp. TaxID=2025608 RepID=UPI002733137E|nr:replication-associated recombination protein A [Sulfuricurvum sp.]MDP2849974.1 replication-associated recombination protein A [Sulfuricurvum sp.]MDP3291733.1 replication-associated recombination protein A [Sulfuricurvum sp.]